MMEGYTFSKISLKRLQTCDERLQRIAHEAIRASSIDFMITEGHRSVKRQKLLFDAGRSRIDGIDKKGKHNYNPSLAFDICAIIKGKASWRQEYLCYLGGVIMTSASMMHIPLRWGGNWDMDGEIITDQSFDDLPHFELLTTKK